MALKDDMDVNSLASYGRKHSELDQFGGPITGFHRPQAVGQYYRDQKILIDGYHFIGCRFDRCHLVVNSSNFEFTNCIIDVDCRIQYMANLAPLFQLFMSRYDWATEEYFPAFFVPARNLDGSITIAPRI